MFTKIVIAFIGAALIAYLAERIGNVFSKYRKKPSEKNQQK